MADKAHDLTMSVKLPENEAFELTLTGLGAFLASHPRDVFCPQCGEHLVIDRPESSCPKCGLPVLMELDETLS